MLKLEEKKQTISDSEWEVMRIVWTIGATHTSQIIEQLQTKEDWSESTIKTLIRRLVKKGILAAKKDGRRYIYTATVGQTEMMIHASQELLDKMCDMHKGAVILQLLSESPISKTDLSKMQDLLAKKAATAPDSVPCNCLDHDQCHGGF